MLPAVQASPLLRLALLGAVIALAPLAWSWLRHRGAPAVMRWRALALLTLFLTFDLVLFGAFTRLTDSGLGCPDWPGCYGHASPIGAHADIQAAESALPSGPVTTGKAWIEMLHRYLAAGVGVLIAVLALAAWRLRGERGAPSFGWALTTLVWVCVQGAFGALTVTMKLYPAIVTAHLLGGLVLLALLTWQTETLASRPSLSLGPGLRVGLTLIAAMSVLQIALGGWVSTNYAVLACTDFPTCQGRWWPAMDFARGFTLARELGQTADGAFLPFAALTAIHYTHRLGAYAVLAGLAALVLALARAGQPRWAAAVGGVALWQLASGVSNVVLGWPLVAAVAHTAGAAALVILLTALAARMRRGSVRTIPR